MGSQMLELIVPQDGERSTTKHSSHKNPMLSSSNATLAIPYTLTPQVFHLPPSTCLSSSPSTDHLHSLLRIASLPSCPPHQKPYPITFSQRGCKFDDGDGNGGGDGNGRHHRIIAEQYPLYKPLFNWPIEGDNKSAGEYAWERGWSVGFLCVEQRRSFCRKCSEVPIWERQVELVVEEGEGRDWDLWAEVRPVKEEGGEGEGEGEEEERVVSGGVQSESELKSESASLPSENQTPTQKPLERETQEEQ